MALGIDPVCGMEVDPEHAADSMEYRGQTYHFCSATCAEKFGRDPEKYLGGEEPPVAAA